jgi:beta-glucosidase
MVRICPRLPVPSLAISVLGLSAILLGCERPSSDSSKAMARQPVEDRDGGDSTTWVNDRVAAVVAQLTLAEKISQLQHDAPAVERLGIARYDYWNEALHGVMTNAATSFPSPIALGATWNPTLVGRVATVISDEARGINIRDGKGLTYWAPVINMLRDPRWGRHDESFGEDPFHMSEMGVAFVRGMQGDDPKYLKTVATPKHFALNNSEYNRHTGSSNIDEQTLWEYYLPAFEATVMRSGAFSVMSAYNQVNEVPASANVTLLEEILRKKWGFVGYVVSDCDAVSDIVNTHHWTATLAEAAAAALSAGTDLNCGTSYPRALMEAIDRGLVTETDVDRALARVLRARFLLGEFDPPEAVPYHSILPDVVESEASAALALAAAREAIVLLKNDSNLLPLDRTKLNSVAVIGPHGNDVTMGGWTGNPTRRVDALSAIIAKLATSSNVRVEFAEGTSITGPKDQAAIDGAVALARESDVALVFAGTSLDVLREEMDRPDWALPGAQEELIEAVAAANPKTILILTTAGPLGIDWAEGHVPAILTAFYAGQEQGGAIADVLFGDYNPGGKLSTTWYKLDATLPPIGDYDIRKGRTYLYYGDVPLYPFGYGLSYTRFSYAGLSVTPEVIAPDGEARVTVEITNSGSLAGDEVVQLYVRDLEASVPRPIQQLRGFSRVHLDPEGKKTVTFDVRPRDLGFWDVSSHGWRVEPGDFELRIGSSSADIRAKKRLTVSTDANLGSAGSAGATSLGLGLAGSAGATSLRPSEGGHAGDSSTLGGVPSEAGAASLRPSEGGHAGDSSTVGGAPSTVVRTSNGATEAGGDGCACRLAGARRNDRLPAAILMALAALRRKRRGEKSRTPSATRGPAAPIPQFRE